MVTAWHSYTHHHNTTLQIVCSVASFPPAKVDWTREDGEDVKMERFRVEFHQDPENQDKVLHVLIIDNPTQQVGVCLSLQ